jgi:hypothetical protein
MGRPGSQPPRSCIRNVPGQPEAHGLNLHLWALIKSHQRRSILVLIVSSREKWAVNEVVRH